MLRWIAALVLLAGSAAAQQPRPNRTLIPAIAPQEGTAGVAGIVDRRNSAGCVIALGLKHRTGRTREVATAHVEIFTSAGMSEIVTAIWQFADEDNIRWTEVSTSRACQARPTVVIRSLRLCGPLDRAPLCEPELVPIRPASYSPLPWLEVTYRTGPRRMTPEEIQRLPAPR